MHTQKNNLNKNSMSVCMYVCILRVATVMVRPVLETERLEIWHSVGNFSRDELKLVPFHSC